MAATKKDPVVLPTLQELHYDVEKAFKNDQFNLLLNQPPHEKWIKEHPMIDNWKYIPVDKIEFLILRIFGQWKREVLREGVMFNSVYAVVRLWVLHPVTGEWTYHDGGGAAPVQTDKGFSAADLSHIKNAAVQIALPSAISYALKDAAECLGKLFGKDLNKKDVIAFRSSFESPDPKPKTPEPKPAAAVITVPDQTSEFEL